ncbi:MAG: insulinase family protein [Deinococcales bacterium]
MRHFSKHHLGHLLLILIGSLIPLAKAQDLRDMISTYTLDNGLRVIFVQQDFAPVISLNFMFGVGGMDEPDGLGGLSHMVEHMAFKGTRSIGSYDLEAELKAHDEVEILNTMVIQAQR